MRPFQPSDSVGAVSGETRTSVLHAWRSFASSSGAGVPSPVPVALLSTLAIMAALSRAAFFSGERLYSSSSIARSVATWTIELMRSEVSSSVPPM